MGTLGMLGGGVVCGPPLRASGLGGRRGACVKGLGGPHWAAVWLPPVLSVLAPPRFFPSAAFHGLTSLLWQ